MVNNLITPDVHTDMKLLAAMINKAATFFSADREDGRIYYEEDGQLFIHEGLFTMVGGQYGRLENDERLYGVTLTPINYESIKGFDPYRDMKRCLLFIGAPRLELRVAYRSIEDLAKEINQDEYTLFTKYLNKEECSVNQAMIHLMDALGEWLCY